MKKQSDKLLDAVFTQDADYRVGNLYDCYCNLLERDVEFKFQFSKTYSFTKDQVEYYVQFRPLYHPEKRYIWEDGIERMGFYIDIPDDSGDIRKWLIVGRTDKPFTRYLVLQCNHTMRYLINGTIYETLGVLRSRNNYNSGVWDDGFVQTIQNQTQIVVPTNSYTNLIDYDLRVMITDNPIHPHTWMVTKREDMFPLGVLKIVFSQEHFNPNTDNVELRVCDYYKTGVTPNEKSKIQKCAVVTSGDILYIGGSSRTVKFEFYDSNGDIIKSNADNVPILNTDYFYSFEFNGVTYKNDNLNGLEEYFTVTSFDENNSFKIGALNRFDIIGKSITINILDKDDETVLATNGFEVRR